MATQIQTTAGKVLTACEDADRDLRFTDEPEEVDCRKRVTRIAGVMNGLRTDTVVLLDLADAITIRYRDREPD